MTEEAIKNSKVEDGEPPKTFNYRIRFRQDGQEFTASSTIEDLRSSEVVMVKTDHGLEPAVLVCKSIPCAVHEPSPETAMLTITRRSTLEEKGRLESLEVRERQARMTCLELIEKHQLSMKLIRVERYFDSSKMSSILQRRTGLISESWSRIWFASSVRGLRCDRSAFVMKRKWSEVSGPVVANCAVLRL